jgi:hypothetical protein
MASFHFKQHQNFLLLPISSPSCPNTSSICRDYCCKRQNSTRFIFFLHTPSPTHNIVYLFFHFQQYKLSERINNPLLSSSFTILLLYYIEQVLIIPPSKNIRSRKSIIGRNRIQFLRQSLNTSLRAEI